jgi:hypothetical protein
MKRTELLFVAFLAVLGFALAGFTPVYGQTAPGTSPAQPKISEDEAKLAEKINAAPDAAGKLKAASELLKKHPKTAIRSQVAYEIANHIEQVKDPAQKLALAQQYQTIFSDPADEEAVTPTLIEALIAANQPDQAFAKGSDFLTRHPDSLRVLVQLMSIAADQAKKQNPKFVDPGIRYGTQIIAIAEADKKPASFDDANWQQFKTTTLPSIHQSMGLLHMSKGAMSEAKAQYAKASQLSPADAFNYVMLAAILNDEYHSAAKSYQSMPSGAAKDAQLTKVQGLLDSVIDALARAIALSEGNAELQSVRQQYQQDFEMYYKYRNNNSTAGMQQLIDKYKPAPKP